MDVDGCEKHRCSHRMHISDQPTVIHIAHDVLDGFEGAAEGRNVMHREYDAGHDHDHQHDARERSKIPKSAHCVIFRASCCHLHSLKVLSPRLSSMTSPCY